MGSCSASRPARARASRSRGARAAGAGSCARCAQLVREGARVGRQPRGRGRAGRDAPARAGPPRRARARTSLETPERRRGGGLRAAGRAAASGRGSVELRGADAAAARGPAHAAGAPARGRGARARTRALLAARLEALGHFEARVEADVPDGGGRCRSCSSPVPGRAPRVARCDVEGPPLPAAGDDKGPEELALRAGQPYRLADVARAARRWSPPGAAPATSTCACAAEVTLLGGARRGARGAWWSSPGPRTIVEHVVLAGLDLTRDEHRRARDGAAPRRALLVRARAREPAAALQPRHLRARLDRRARPRAASGAATWW